MPTIFTFLYTRKYFTNCWSNSKQCQVMVDPYLPSTWAQRKVVSLNYNHLRFQNFQLKEQIVSKITAEIIQRLFAMKLYVGEAFYSINGISRCIYRFSINLPKTALSIIEKYLWDISSIYTSAILKIIPTGEKILMHYS